MKCENLVKLRKQKRSGRLVVDKRAPIFNWRAPQQSDPPHTAQHVTCGGQLRPRIKLEADPYWGGCGFDIEIEYKCSRCGTYADPLELPQDVKGLEEFLAQIIAELPRREVERLREKLPRIRR